MWHCRKFCHYWRLVILTQDSFSLAICDSQQVKRLKILEFSLFSLYVRVSRYHFCIYTELCTVCLHSEICFYFISYSVLATTLLMSPILYFWEMSGFEPRELPKQAGALTTYPTSPCECEFENECICLHVIVFKCPLQRLEPTRNVLTSAKFRLSSATTYGDISSAQPCRETKYVNR